MNDLVTRDDDGNVIPPSRRFDEGSSDVRYKVGENRNDFRSIDKRDKEELAEIGDYILGNKYATELTGKEFPKGETKLREVVANYYKENYGGQVARDGFGTVLLDMKGVKSSLQHGIGREKAIAFAAVPDVIKNGWLVDVQPNWKGGPLTSYIFAAPIKIGDEGYVCMVVVRRGDLRTRFYLHEVTLQPKNPQDGSFTTAYERGHSHHGDIAKILQKIINAKEEIDNLRKNNSQGGNAEVEVDATTADKVAEAEQDVDTNPTDAQKEAGNYRKGHVKVDGMEVSIENPKGSVRSGKDAKGREWSVTMNNTYGYIGGTKGKDGDHIDVFLSDSPDTGDVYVVDQVNPETGEFDEHKVMYGFANEDEARKAYLSNYEEGWKGLGNITRVDREEFKKWLKSSTRKTKPFAEYKSVKPAEGLESVGELEYRVEKRRVDRTEIKNSRQAYEFLKRFDGRTFESGRDDRHTIHVKRDGSVDIENEMGAEWGNRRGTNNYRGMELTDVAQMIQEDMNKNWWRLRDEEPREGLLFDVGNKRNDEKGGESGEKLVNLQPKSEKEDGNIRIEQENSGRNGVGEPIHGGTQRRGTVGGSSGLVQGARNNASRIESRNVSPRNNASGARLDKSISRKSVQGGNAEGERITSQESTFSNRIKGLTDQFNIPFVILNTPEELDAVARRNGLRDFQDEEYLASHFVKGFVSDNVPYLYVPDILGDAIEKDIDLGTAAVRAVFHEGVSHYGLGRMLGRYYDDFCDNVYKGLSKANREKNLAYVWNETLDDGTRTSLLNKFGKDSGAKWKDLTEGEKDQVFDAVGKELTRGAADEHIANIAEMVATGKELTKEERSFWERFTDWVRTLFGAKGLTDEEIAEAVRLSRDLYSKENGEEGEVEGKIKNAHEILDREAPEVQFSIDDTASKLGGNLGIDIDTTDEGRREQDRYTLDPETGKISLVSKNNRTPKDAERSILTAVTQRGNLREVFGNEAYNDFIDDIFQHSGEETRREITNLAMQNGLDFRKATEQYLADAVARDDFNTDSPWWGTIKRDFQNILGERGFSEITSRAGFGEEGGLSDNDLRYVLWKNYRNDGTNRGAMGVAEDVAMQDKLGVGNYAPIEEDVRFSIDDERTGAERTEDTINRLVDMMANYRDNLEVRNNAMQGISDAFHAIQAQGKYDRATVQTLTDVVNKMIQDGLLDPSRGDTKRILSAVKNGMDRSVGGNETRFKDAIYSLGNVLADNQLRVSRQALDDALSVQTEKIGTDRIKKQGAVDGDTAVVIKNLKKLLFGETSPRVDDDSRILGKLCMPKFG